MKKCLWLILLSFFVFFASKASASELPDFPFVYAAGQAETEVVPDTAKVSFRVAAFDKEPERALAVVEERSRDLVSLFAKYGIDKRDVVAYELGKRTIRETKNYTQLDILGYETDRRFSVTFRKLEEYDRLIAALFDLKNVSDIHTVFDSSRRTTVETELVAKASAKARQHADALAKGFGHAILSVFAITTSDMGFAYLSRHYGLGEAAFSSMKGEAPLSTSTIFVPSTIKLQKTVTAIFKLKI